MYIANTRQTLEHRDEVAPAVIVALRDDAARAETAVNSLQMERIKILNNVCKHVH